MIGIIEPPATAEQPPADSASENLVLSQLWAFDEDHLLGTRLRVLVNAPIEALARRAAVAAKREIERLDAVFNWRRSDSELTVLNKNRIGVASAELFAVVQLAETWRRITLGAFDGRLGELFQLWSHADSPAPNSIHAARHRPKESSVLLRPVQREIELSLVSLSLDAIAKGYIVDAALNAARREVPSINGVAVNIGGDIRCWGEAPPRMSGECGWRVGISDPIRPADNAPIVDVVLLQNAAIATSGRGPRDCVQGRYRSTTISPFTGRPVNAVISASVVGSHAADADAIATACLVLPPRESLALVERLDGVAARITDAKGRVHESSGWRKIQVAAATPKKPAAKSTQPNSTSTQPETESLPVDRRWPADWEIGVSYVAPDKNESERSADFRTPYMVLWISDEENRPVYTLTMVGQDPKWQKDNYIWWTTHGERSVPLVELRSQATALSGRYRLFWGGLDEQWRPLPIGNYVLHIETSQERGKHTHRSVTLEIGRERFKKSLPNLPESGGLEITYGHYNDRFKDE